MRFGVKESLTDRNIKKTTQPAKKKTVISRIYLVYFIFRF